MADLYFIYGLDECQFGYSQFASNSNARKAEDFAKVFRDSFGIDCEAGDLFGTRKVRGDEYKAVKLKVFLHVNIRKIESVNLPTVKRKWSK